MSIRVPWIPTPRIVIEYLMYVLNIGPHDTILDLGCGDGRLLINAAKRGARGICIEIDRVMCNITSIASKLAGVEDRIKIICTDFFTTNLKELEPRPNIVYAYLYTSILSELAPKLEQELDPGTIIITLDFSIRNWSPFYVKHIVDENDHDRALWFYLIGISNPSARYVGISREYKLIAEKLKNKTLYLD